MQYSHPFKELSFLTLIVAIGWVPGRLSPLEKNVPQRCFCSTSLPVKIATQATAVYKKRKKIFKIIIELHHHKYSSTTLYMHISNKLSF